jgi:hypothetical protein
VDFLQALNENLCSLEMTEVLAAIEEAIEGRLLAAEDIEPNNFTSDSDFKREEFLAVKVNLCLLKIIVAEPHHSGADPTTDKSFDAAPALTLLQTYSKQQHFIKSIGKSYS